MAQLCLLGLHRCPANHHGECLGDKYAMKELNLCTEEDEA